MIPQDLSDRYQDWAWTVAYHFDPGAPTYRLTRGGETRFVKVHPVGRGIPDEANRLRWARGHAPVPELVEYGSDGDHDWLMTVGLSGVDATRWAGEPRRLVTALAEGLRWFHEHLPADECPFDFTAGRALAHVRARLEAGLITPAESGDLTPEAAVASLESTVPPAGRIVVCHGDYCLPNVMLTGERVTGYLDLDRLAVADPWWDLAAAVRSCDFNLGPGYAGPLIEAYGVAPDPPRLAWYRLLHDLA